MTKRKRQTLTLNRTGTGKPTVNGTLTSKKRDDLSDSEFALPGRRYPIHDEAHARNALARVAQYGTPEEQAKVEAAVHKKFPNIGKDDQGNVNNSTGTTSSGLTLNSLQAITANFKAPVRHAQLEGKNYVVAPMVMITEGVHKGSNGALYYPEEELAKTPAVWNHKPIVVYHPTLNGQAISACDPVVLEKRKVGLIMNTGYEPGSRGNPGRLKAEAWLDQDKLKKVDDRVLNALQKGLMVEVSTGLFTDNASETGRWKNEDYDAVARNYRPDHLAILPDEEGACSIADGAGLLRNSAPDSGGIKKKLTEELCSQKATLPTGLPGSTPEENPWISQVTDTFCVAHCGDKAYKLDYTQDSNGNVKFTGKPEEIIAKYMTTDGKTLNTSTHNGAPPMTKKQIVNALIANEATAWDEPDRKYLMSQPIEQLQKFALVDNGEFKKQASGLDTEDDGGDDQSDTVKDAADQVKPKKGGKPVGGVKADQGAAGGRPEGGRPQGNSSSYDDDALNHTEPTQTASEKDDDEDDTSADGSQPNGKGVQNSAQRRQPMTTEEYINNAPAGVREVLVNGLRAHEAEKQRLIKTITANKANPFKPEVLNKKPVDELRGLAALASAGMPKPVRAEPVANGAYLGLGDVVVPTTNESTEPEEALEIPVMNFSKRED